MGTYVSRSSGGGGKFADAYSLQSFLQANKGNEDLRTVLKSGGMEAVRDEWITGRMRQEQSSIHQLSEADAVDTIRNTVPQNALDGWFVKYDSEYKPAIADAVLGTPGAYNAALNIAYYNSGATMPFDKWLRTPQTMYRGEHGQTRLKSDVFSSYTPDKNVAQGFAGKNGTVGSIKIRPIDTLGNMQTTAEFEFLVPRKQEKRK